jgi:sigma-B regulation protein RsbU (phosphoserine phosphatase)
MEKLIINRHSIVTRLVVTILGCVAMIFVVTLGYNYYQSRATLLGEMESNAKNLAVSIVSRIEIELAGHEKLAQGLALALETGNYSESDIQALLRKTVERHPTIYGAGISFEPFAFNPKTELYSPYFYRNGEQILHTSLEQSYAIKPYTLWDWYKIPRQSGEMHWSEPYFDDGGGNTTMSTCALPFWGEVDGLRKIRGIVGVDISLGQLTALVSSVKVLQSGYAALLSRDGLILAHPRKDLIMRQSLYKLAETRQDKGLNEIPSKMAKGESGFAQNKNLIGQNSWLYYAPIPSTGWILEIVFPEDELLAELRKLNLTMACIALIGLFLLSFAVIWIAARITSPLRDLASATEEISLGNFDVRLPAPKSQDEVGMLTRNFSKMTSALKQYIIDLTETTAAKNRIESDLKVATDIQANLLPHIFPAFPHRYEFDIYASMDPAKEVGGDFYDFFFIEDHRLCIIIADVTDKGVPAALYMMVTKILLKSEGQRLNDPSLILSSVNKTLAMDNDSCMFATVFCGILDTRTGLFECANAGHCSPVLLDSSGVRYLHLKNGLVLGAIPDSIYTTQLFTLQEGDTIFLYTDGVTEAKNPANNFYSDERLIESLKIAPRNDLEQMVHFIKRDVENYAADTPQFDDITMLAMTFKHLAR